MPPSSSCGAIAGANDTRFIYHGNDGTSFPWNDTAQLNYLNPEVREAVIQNILHVARLSPIIRFDAAMTLTKQHYQRLWFPQPGSGGGIPSRAEHGLTKAEFDRAMPNEFWREVVDRVAPSKFRARCCWRRPSGCSKDTSCARWACIACTTALS